MNIREAIREATDRINRQVQLDLKRDLYLTGRQAIEAFRLGILDPHDQTLNIWFYSGEDCRMVEEFLKTFQRPEA